MFNYYPTQDAPKSAIFLPAKESVDTGRNLKNLRYKLLEIKASIAQGQLVTSWSYSTQLYRPMTIEALSRRFLEIIHTLIGELAGK
jgi:non-ribosomal peptide synthase protein (TIGR01720 family)